MDISGLECIKDAEENWSIPGLRRGLTSLEGVFLGEIERLSKLVMEQAIDIAYLHSERDALKAKLELAENYISVLEMAADGYYRVEKSEEAKAWYAAQEDEQK